MKSNLITLQFVKITKDHKPEYSEMYLFSRYEHYGSDAKLVTVMGRLISTDVDGNHYDCYPKEPFGTVIAFAKIPKYEEEEDALQSK